jgi:hypothetical protein
MLLLEPAGVLSRHHEDHNLTPCKAHVLLSSSSSPVLLPSEASPDSSLLPLDSVSLVCAT